MNNLKRLHELADIAWVNYTSAYCRAYASYENLRQATELKAIYEGAEESLQLKIKQLDNH